MTRVMHILDLYIIMKEQSSSYLTTTILSMRGAAVANAFTPTNGTARPVTAIIYLAFMHINSIVYIFSKVHGILL